MKKDYQKDQEERDKGDEVRRKSEKVVHRLQEKAKTHFPADDIRNELSHREKKAQNDWNGRFGHLSKYSFQKVFSEECKKMNLSEKSPSANKSSKDLHNNWMMAMKSSSYFPKTSSGTVGWRSSLAEHNLELLGKLYNSPRLTIEPPLQLGEFRITEQTLISLG